MPQSVYTGKMAEEQVLLVEFTSGAQERDHNQENTLKFFRRNLPMHQLLNMPSWHSNKQKQFQTVGDL